MNNKIIKAFLPLLLALIAFTTGFILSIRQNSYAIIYGTISVVYILLLISIYFTLDYVHALARISERATKPLFILLSSFATTLFILSLSCCLFAQYHHLGYILTGLLLGVICIALGVLIAEKIRKKNFM